MLFVDVHHFARPWRSSGVAGRGHHAGPAEICKPLKVRRVVFLNILSAYSSHSAKYLEPVLTVGVFRSVERRMVFRVFFCFLRVSWLVVCGILLWMCLCKLCCVLVATPCCGALFTVAGKKTPLMMHIHVWLASVAWIGMNYPRCVPWTLFPSGFSCH